MSEVQSCSLHLRYAKAPEYNSTSMFYIEGVAVTLKTSFFIQPILHYSYNKEKWHTLSLEHQHSDNKNIFWYFKTPGTYSSNECTFFIECGVGRSLIIDNNYNNNYRLAWYSPTKILQACAVKLDRVLRSPDKLFGNITVKNLSYQKQIKIIYSPDHWTTQNEVEAFFKEPICATLENWEFSIPVAQEHSLELSISYIENGNIHLDDNFGKGYTF
ncbi:MAG: CBM21 domain-containing protein [Clostridia bacterium]|nr:CBM21 domain-containing protein [Clostridia bacterium]